MWPSCYCGWCSYCSWRYYFSGAGVGVAVAVAVVDCDGRGGVEEVEVVVAAGNVVAAAVADGGDYDAVAEVVVDNAAVAADNTLSPQLALEQSFPLPSCSPYSGSLHNHHLHHQHYIPLQPHTLDSHFRRHYSRQDGRAPFPDHTRLD